MSPSVFRNILLKFAILTQENCYDMQLVVPVPSRKFLFKQEDILLNYAFFRQEIIWSVVKGMASKLILLTYRINVPYRHRAPAYRCFP